MDVDVKIRLTQTTARVLLVLTLLLIAGKIAFGQQLPGPGQRPMSGSIPVVVSSDQSTIPVTCVSGCAGSGTTDVNVTNASLAVTNTNLDIALSALRDALRGASAKTLTDVVTALGALSVSISGSVAVTGPLTDTQLRATPVPISGTVTTGGLTDTQLRASAVAMSLASLPALPAGSAVIGHVIVDTAPSTAVTNANLDVALSTLATASAQTTGNNSLATIATNTGLGATASNQTTQTAYLATIAGPVDTVGTPAPASVLMVGGMDRNANTSPFATSTGGVLSTYAQPQGTAAFLLPCNALRRTNCR